MSSLEKYPVVISACLLGVKCRYDGDGCGCESITQLSSKALFIPVCPEQLGGLPTPRPPARIVDGDGRDVLSGIAKVVNSSGAEVTHAFIRGAEESFKLARMAGARIAFFKDKSPSCGTMTPYCDAPEGVGIGVTAALFVSAGIKVYDIDPEKHFYQHELLKKLEVLNVRTGND